MNSNDEFESYLQRTPLKRPPSEWREEILVAADVNRRTSPVRELTFAATAEDRATTRRSQRCESLDHPVRELTFAATWRRRLQELFWPHPVAWGVMATLWVAIVGVHLALREPATSQARVKMAAWSGLPTMLAMQEEILAALNEEQAPPPPAPSHTVPPQSYIERRRESYDV